VPKFSHSKPNQKNYFQREKLTMTLDLINSTTEETRQQLSDLLLCADHDQAVSEIANEVEKLSKFAKQGYSKWKGSKKGRVDNLSIAINTSINDLQEKGLTIKDNSIIANLWVANVGLEDLHTIIQEVVKGLDDKESYVAWIDKRGNERKSDFVAVKARIRRKPIDNS
jgi:Na+/phosphate symporter